MLLWILAYAGGVLTIISPCILPVLPFVFARADQPFVKSGLPLLLGMALTFAGVATLAAVGGGWAVAANEYGRHAALLMLAVFGVTLLFPSIAQRLTQPLVALGARLSERASASTSPSADPRSPFVPSLLLGLATGLLWAPCAGPILGLVLTGAALEGANVGTSLLLLAYAAGAATSLALALLIGGRVFQVMKRSLGAGEWIRRGLGVALLASVAAIALGLDTGALTRLSLASTAQLEQALVDQVAPPPSEAMSGAMTGAMAGAMTGAIADASPAGGAMMRANPDTTATADEASTVMSNEASGAMMMQGNGAMMRAAGAGTDGADAAHAPASEGMLPSLSGAVEWLNSPPLTAEGLRGKVVLVDFWTYSCINCLRSIPYVRAWAEKYKDQGLVVIGVHAPEFAFEKKLANVRQATQDLHIGYPVAIDNDFAIWRAFKNRFWPAHYFIDAQGRVRHHHFGEGEYEASERVIQQLLAEVQPGQTRDASTAGVVSVADAQGAQAPADTRQVLSPETYLGHERAQHFAGPGGLVRDQAHRYAGTAPLLLNQWTLQGDWSVGPEHADVTQGHGRLRFQFHARDLHLVMGPAADGKPVNFRVLIDGQPPRGDHGADIDAQGHGRISGQRLYQLIRLASPVTERLFEIEFLDPGAQVYAFTFG